MDPISIPTLGLLQSTAVEIDLLILIPTVSESIPLRANLRIESKAVVVYRPQRFVLYNKFELGPAKTWLLHTIQKLVGGYTDSVDDFCCCFPARV